jgi:adenosylhomocysteine nucleosidase
LKVAGVVAALASEARALGPAAQDRDRGAILRDGTRVAVSGIGHAAATRACVRLLEQGAAALVSWGLAGALDPQLAAGAVCLPSEVIGANGTCFKTSPLWRERLATLCAAQLPVACGRLLTSSRALDTVADKDSAYRATGAVAVDMESSAVAEVAASCGVPFIAVRVIADTAADALPRAVVAASREGRVRVWRLMRGLVLAPHELGSLIRLAQRYRVAIRSLSAVAGTGALALPKESSAVSDAVIA